MRGERRRRGRPRGPLAVLTLSLLLLAHCAWRVDGLAAFVAWRRAGEARTTTDSGVSVTLLEARISVAEVSLVRCASARFAWPDGLGPGRASAHGGEPTSSPFVVDLVAPSDRVEVDAVPVVPGRYCDVRVRLAPVDGTPTMQLAWTMPDGAVRRLRSEAERVRVLPWRSSDTPGVVFDGTHRTASLSLLFDLGPTLARTDVDGASDVAGFAALGGLLDGLSVGP